jgi:Ser/Thr protein kinase RdoA (MazF antagonist)
MSARELVVLGTQLHGVCSTLAQSGIRDTLSHLDLNPGNILVAENHCVFLDWAEACVGHPFVSFEYLLEHMRKLFSVDEALKSKLAAAYTHVWRRITDAQTIAEALAAAPVLSVFTCAIAGGTWRDGARRSRPEVAGLLRSLTRRMKREADAFAERRITCLS